MAYTSEQFMATKERLWTLRKDRGLTLKQVSEELRNHGCHITDTTLNNYEFDDESHKNFHRTKSIKIEVLVALADMYGVSVDYLLGRSEVQKRENHQISEELGLSENTIDLLRQMAKKDLGAPLYGRKVEIINQLFANATFADVLEMFRAACYDYLPKRSRESLSAADKEEIDFWERNDNKLEEAKDYIRNYGLKAVNWETVFDLKISRILHLMDDLARKIPIELVDAHYHQSRVRHNQEKK